ncbi:hypothetical protein VTN31DRAFT_6167 [Thermomyces dupontii]|uniref:uncharacterized protein n=1 Tax=Talaromyces thermophilus TaxID=28565 RepID=UPI00374420B3
MNPYLSWAIVLVVAGGLGWYYTEGSRSKGRTSVRTAAEKNEAPLAAPKQKKQKSRKSPGASSAPARKVEEKPAQSAPVYTTGEETDVDNKEFAKQLAAARTGVAVGETKNKERRVRTTPIANAPESGSSEVSGRFSTNGADADDDLSSSDLPSKDDVSDMLEKPAPGASVLRLTGSMESKPKQAKQPVKKPAETKKQRQNRRKNEEQKQLMEEAEKERRRLLEKQLHTAREAERQEAKKAPSASATNAWKTTQPPAHPEAKVNGVSTAANVPLLDTFDPEPSQASNKWAQNLPPEEEQMRILGVSQSSDDWTTVPSKKAKKKTTKTEDGGADGSASDTPAAGAESSTERAAPKKTITPVKMPIPDARVKGHPLDSDWAA